MNKSELDALLRLGLEQLPAKDLRRGKKYIEAGKPLLLTGDVYDPEVGCG